MLIPWCRDNDTITTSIPIQFILWHNSKIKYNGVHENKSAICATGHNNANSENE